MQLNKKILLTVFSILFHGVIINMETNLQKQSEHDKECLKSINLEADPLRVAEYITIFTHSPKHEYKDIKIIGEWLADKSKNNHADALYHLFKNITDNIQTYPTDTERQCAITKVIIDKFKTIVYTLRPSPDYPWQLQLMCQDIKKFKSNYTEL